MHYREFNEMHGENAGLGLHKNATYCFEQILEAAPNKKKNSWTATSLPSCKPFKYDEQDMLDITREVSTKC